MGLRNPLGGPPNQPPDPQAQTSLMAQKAALARQMYGAVPIVETSRELPKEPVAEPIIATRAWRLTIASGPVWDRSTFDWMAKKWERGENPFVWPMGPRLTGIGHPVTWGAPIMRAICVAHGFHDSPARDCACGFWGMKTNEKRLRLWLQNEYDIHGGGIVIGKVKMWGRVFEHAHGYRAEFAQPIELTVVRGPAPSDTAESLREFYGCETRTST